jgi:hypothetical protein
MKQLCGRVEHEDVDANFLFHFLTFQKMSEMHFKINGAYARMSQNTTPHLI